MNKELMITKEDLVNWLDRPPSNDDLDLIGFITTRLENFYKLEQENKQLKLNHKQLSDISKMAICNSRLIQENKQLKELYKKTCKHLFDIGNDELARYFKAQIDENNTFMVGDM